MRISKMGWFFIGTMFGMYYLGVYLTFRGIKSVEDISSIPFSLLLLVTVFYIVGLVALIYIFKEKEESKNEVRAVS